MPPQGVEIGLRPAGERAHQDDDITGPDGPQSVAVRDLLLLPQHLRDARGDKLRLGRRAVRRRAVPGRAVVDGMQLHGRLTHVRECPVGAQRLGIAVDKAAGPLRHRQAENVIRCRQDFRMGTEIIRKQDAARLSFCRFLRKRAVFFQKNGRVGQTEAVDGLLHVADKEHIAALPRDRGINCLLHAVRILIFVHENFGVAPGHLAGGRRRRAGAVRQQAKGKMLQIVVVEQVPSALFRRKARGKCPRQGQQSAQRLRASAELPQRLVRLQRERLEPAPHARDGVRAQALDALLRLRVGAFSDRRETAEIRRDARKRLPRSGRGQRLEQQEIGLQHGRIGGNGLVLLSKRQRAAQHGRIALQAALQLPQQPLAPDRLAGVRAVRHIQHDLPAVRRRSRIGIALQIRVDAHDQLLQCAVVPSCAGQIQRSAHGGRRICIGLLENGAHGALPQGGCLLLVCKAEIGGQLQNVGIVPQERRAEAVDRGDLRQIDAAELPLQMAVLRVGGKAAVQLRQQLAAQLRCSRLREGDEQEFVDAPALADDLIEHAIDQNAGLTGACGRRDQQGAAAALHRRPLSGRQYDLSHALSFPASARIPPP